MPSLMHWGTAGLYRVRRHDDVIVKVRESSTAIRSAGVSKGFQVAALGCVAISSMALDAGFGGHAICRPTYGEPG